MKAIAITAFGAPEVLQLVDRPQPVPQAGEVLIKVAASGVNRPDVSQREGNYPPPPGISDLPGLEIAGEIVGGDLSHPDNIWGLKSGSAVCALVAGGGYAEYCVAPIAQCLPVPAGLSMVAAAALPETYFTVWTNVFDRARLGHAEDGRLESLLVHGGGSGIGVTAIQIAHALGHRVFATAGSEEKCRATERLGAARGINYKSEDFVAVVKELTEGRGVDVVLDMVAGDYIPRDIDCLAVDGRLALVAVLGGTDTRVDLLKVLMKRLTISGSTLRARSIAFKQAIARKLVERVWPLLETGRIKPEIYATFAPAAAPEAHRLMESNQHIGKIVIDWEK
ncbi:NAD(P)H-quinone oxidoreductase [Noviherbaspirillum sedimenti]|uniref:NAD(P)H-quinone oxidoreductase n=1 Tax=Noviherbaspirillum sedimenti TaxID=2320865 RepID=A0A3A3GQU1_9BURK|nr:NAD(P)H-quinone oxidoreductase [Noviherbaspirillum sedimenti]RJG03340.1 NAD(P)H-quinone oxidoreductase [Noviherbaspirillum sedimenti]